MKTNENTGPINRLITAVIQEQDVESATRALVKLGLKITRLPSTGGFLGRRSTTLLIGFNAGTEEAIVSALQRNCRRRVEYIAIPLDGSPLPLPTPTPVTVGGATVFSLEIVRYVEV